jgi:hypothetical protein
MQDSSPFAIGRALQARGVRSSASNGAAVWPEYYFIRNIRYNRHILLSVKVRYVELSIHKCNKFHKTHSGPIGIYSRIMPFRANPGFDPVIFPALSAERQQMPTPDPHKPMDGRSAGHVMRSVEMKP